MQQEFFCSKKVVFIPTFLSKQKIWKLPSCEIRYNMKKLNFPLFFFWLGWMEFSKIFYFIHKTCFFLIFCLLLVLFIPINSKQEWGISGICGHQDFWLEFSHLNMSHCWFLCIVNHCKMMCCKIDKMYNTWLSQYEHFLNLVLENSHSLIRNQKEVGENLTMTLSMYIVPTISKRMKKLLTE